MRFFAGILSFIAVFTIFSCERKPKIEDDGELEMPTDSARLSALCPSDAGVIPGNQFHAKELNRFVRILPDSNGLHRRLQSLALPGCSLLFEETIPGISGQDLQLAPIMYNLNSKLLGIQGDRRVHCFDVDSNALLPPLVPQFAHETLDVDVQSGTVIRLEVWEDFLIGYAADYGSFVFDMRRETEPRAVLPVAEYVLSDVLTASLFLLPSSDGTFQALVPVYRQGKDAFDINPLFDEPRALDPSGKRVSRGKVVSLRDAEGSLLTVDLEKAVREQ